MLAHIFGDTGVQDILTNPVFKAHFIVAKCNGLTSYENKVAQSAGLLGSILLNKIDRRLLTCQYERFIYRPKTSTLTIKDPYKFTNHYIDFSNENLSDALLASGSIPMVMSGIKNIANSPRGTYRDGGIIDYHFDFLVENKSKSEVENQHKSLTLYPHFNDQPKAGWFDKNSSRSVLTEHYDNTVLLVPSAKFVQSLPYNKIPDRNDFKTLDAPTRIKYWLKVLSETDRLAESFNEFIIKQDLQRIQRF